MSITNKKCEVEIQELNNQGDIVTSHTVDLTNFGLQILENSVIPVIHHMYLTDRGGEMVRRNDYQYASVSLFTFDTNNKLIATNGKTYEIDGIIYSDSWEDLKVGDFLKSQRNCCQNDGFYFRIIIKNSPEILNWV